MEVINFRHNEIKLALIDLTASDGSELHFFMKSPEIARFLPEKSYLPIKKVENLVKTLIKAINSKEGFAWKIVDVSSAETIGLIDILLIEKSVGSLAYLLSDKYWGKGLGTAVLFQVVEHAFKNIGIKKLSAPVVTRNIGSIKILQKNGFKFKERRNNPVNFDGEPDFVEIYELLSPL